ncbi:MAG TPA: TonB-dependent receptor, partial [Blastocatellia bacterium]|nr:TonB-dependent receptor [Blastocatellia bacterium]
GTYSELGATQVTNYEVQDTYSVQPNLTLTKGQHFLKTGVEFRLYNSNRLQPGAASGNFTFGKNWTQADPLRGDALSGNEFASFLLGLPTSGSVDRNIDPAYQNKYYAVFVQDDWRFTPKLTLNLGLRWDYETPIVERFNRQIRGFAFDQASPIASRVSGLTLKGGLLFAGTSGEERMAFVPDRNNFQPRVGTAWQFRDKWVMRAGYGLSFLGQSSNGSAAGFSRPTSLIASTDGNITPAVTMNNPFPTTLFPTGLLQPIGNSLGLATNLGQAVTAQFLNRPLPYSHQFSFGFQRELPSNWLAEVSYVGNITRKLPVSMNMNFIPRDILESRPVAERSAYFTQQIANPMAGLLPGTGLNGANVARQQLLFAFPQYTQVTITDVPIGRQKYHSLQSSLTRRFTRGMAVNVAYTFSKTLERINLLNAQDANLSDLTASLLEQRLYQFDVPHKFAFVFSYELPFGRGKRFGHDMHKIANAIAGGWNLNTQWVKQSGFPFDHPNAAPLAARSAKLTDAERDKRAKNGSTFDVSEDKWFDTTLFPTQAQAPFTLRTFPTRFPDVRSPSPTFVEISTYKEFQIKERVRWQIRADFQNAFNYPFFGVLQSNNVTDTRFGQLRADIGNEPRRIVAVMKITF